MERQAYTWNQPDGFGSRRIFVNEATRSGTVHINYSNYHTFISHKGDDLDQARRIGDVLYKSGLAGYLDHWDPMVDGDSPELEIHLRNVIQKTPSMIAAVSEKTNMSW